MKVPEENSPDAELVKAPTRATSVDGWSGLTFTPTKKADTETVKEGCDEVISRVFFFFLILIFI